MINDGTVTIFVDGYELLWDTMPPDPLPTGIYGYTVEMTRPGDATINYDSLHTFGVVNVRFEGLPHFGVYRHVEYSTGKGGVIMRVSDRVGERLEAHLIQNFLQHLDDSGGA